MEKETDDFKYEQGRAVDWQKLREKQGKRGSVGKGTN